MLANKKYEERNVADAHQFLESSPELSEAEEVRISCLYKFDVESLIKSLCNVRSFDEEKNYRYYRQRVRFCFTK